MFHKAFYILAEYRDQKNDRQGGVAQIPPDKMGEAVKTIQDYGCDSVSCGFIDPVPLSDADKMFRECCDAAGLALYANCPLVGTVAPTLADIHNPFWYEQRNEEWSDWNIEHWGYAGILDCEFYRQHPYAKYRNVAWPPEYVQTFRNMLATAATHVEFAWAFGGQNANKLGYAFDVLGDKLMGTDGEFDESAGAFKNDPIASAYDPAIHTKPASPAPNAYPPWFPMGKIVASRRSCSRNGDWVAPGSVWRKQWSFTGAPDGILYSSDDQLLSNLGLQ